MCYQLVFHLYFDKISKFPVFEQFDQHSIMNVAMLMRSRLSLNDEEVIAQGDESDCFFIILRGQVGVHI